MYGLINVTIAMEMFLWFTYSHNLARYRACLGEGITFHHLGEIKLQLFRYWGRHLFLIWTHLSVYNHIGYKITIWSLVAMSALLGFIPRVFLQLISKMIILLGFLLTMLILLFSQLCWLINHVKFTALFLCYCYHYTYLNT